ncbi:citrate lyase subunit gamma [Dickeya zeae EC1]|nr:citrate lyase subunit gamma [Dickeya zeae EC1]AJC66144.1 citrate lyase subunit gamma [Dickeya zeae EC1]
MKIIKEALAGTFESSDLLVRVSPAQGPLTVVINSEVIKQFGAQITRVVNDTLNAMRPAGPGVPGAGPADGGDKQ